MIVTLHSKIESFHRWYKSYVGGWRRWKEVISKCVWDGGILGMRWRGKRVERQDYLRRLRLNVHIRPLRASRNPLRRAPKIVKTIRELMIWVFVITMMRVQTAFGTGTAPFRLNSNLIHAAGIGGDDGKGLEGYLSGVGAGGDDRKGLEGYFERVFVSGGCWMEKVFHIYQVFWLSSIAFLWLLSCFGCLKPFEESQGPFGSSR